MIPGFQAYDKVDIIIVAFSRSYVYAVTAVCLNSICFFRSQEIQMRYPKTPDLDIINGVPIIRSLHVKNNIKFGDCATDSASGIDADLKESKRPTWLVFDKQVLI